MGQKKNKNKKPSSAPKPAAPSRTPPAANPPAGHCELVVAADGSTGIAKVGYWQNKALELKAAGSANASQPEKKGPAMAAAPGEEQHLEEPLVSWAETARTLAGKQAQELPKQPAADVGPIEALVLAFLDKIEQPRQVELVKQLLDPSGDHTMKRDPASCPTLRAANSLMEGLDFEVVRKLGKGASSCVYEIRAGPRRFAFKLGYVDGDPEREKWGMRIGQLWETSEPYFPKVYMVRKYARDSAMAAGGARGSVVMDLVGNGVSLQELLMSGLLPAPGTPERIAWATKVSSMIADMTIYMNKAKVYHHDFKADNVIVVGGRGGLDVESVMVIDWEEAFTENEQVGGAGCQRSFDFRRTTDGASNKEMSHIFYQLFQALEAARMVAATFIDLAALVADEERWSADEYEIPDDSQLDDQWLPEHWGSMLVMMRGYYIRTRQLHWSCHVTITLLKESIDAHPEWFGDYFQHVQDLLLLSKADWSRTPAKSVEDWVLPEGAVMLFFTKEGAKRFDEKQKMWRKMPNNSHMDPMMILEKAKNDGETSIVFYLRSQVDALIRMANEGLGREYCTLD